MSTRKLPDRFKVAFSFAGEQRDFVRSIAEAVENELGSPNVFFDEWFEQYLAGPGAGRKLQEIYGERSVLVVVCVSERHGGKPWTRQEQAAIQARVMNEGTSDDELDVLATLPIRVGGGDIEDIFFNRIVPDIRDRSATDAAKLIIDRLHLILPDLDRGTPAAQDWPEEPPPFNWPVVNQYEVLTGFKRLLTRTAPWPFLLLRGPSESGKSHITRQMLGNALRIPALACGRFDFKGTTDMDFELRAFIQQLDVPLPPSSSRLNERLNHILAALKHRQLPALLIFDTYEAAGDAEEWVERQLLPSLIRATWLRVVIAGQRVPKVVGTSREAVPRHLITLKPPLPVDWFEYGKRYRPDLALNEVETAFRLVAGKATLLAQLLGPTR